MVRNGECYRVPGDRQRQLKIEEACRIRQLSVHLGLNDLMAKHSGKHTKNNLGLGQDIQCEISNRHSTDMDPDKGSNAAFYRLTNLSQTDLLPHLSLPSYSVDAKADCCSNELSGQNEICTDAKMLSELDKMLQAADISTM